MKIACLTTSYPRFDGDIAGTFVEELNLELMARGHTIEVFAPKSPESTSNTRHGVHVHQVPYLWPSKWQQTFYDAGAPDNIARSRTAMLGALTFPPVMLAQVMRGARDADALLAHWAMPSGVIASFVAQGRSCIVVFHSADVHLLIKTHLAGMVARTLMTARAQLVFVAPVLRERFMGALDVHLAEAMRKRTHVIPMGVRPPTQTHDRDALRSELGLTRFSLVTLGRLIPLKGIDVLLEAARGVDAEIIVLGDGPERGALEALAEKTGISARFIGTCVGDEKWRWLHAADAFAMPSRIEDERTEGLPVALLEAMTAGLPIVATRVGGMADAVGDDAGVLVTPDDAAALHEAILRIQADAALRDRLSAGALRASRAYAWPMIAPQFDALLSATK